MPKQTLLYLQLFLIRVYLGIDIVPHFLEKLFLGPTRYEADVAAFISMGVSNAPVMVILAGLIEFSIFIGFTFGVMTRIAAVGSSLYILIALFMGHHNIDGFIWVDRGGGWEYPAMWSFLYFSFILTGGGPWSLDAYLRKKTSLFIFR